MNLKDNIIKNTATLMEALRRLNMLSGKQMTLFVTDADSGALLGTLTDGDVRRAIIAGTQLSEPVSSAMHREFKYLRSGESDVEGIRQLRERGIHLVPVLDSENRIQRVLDLRATRNMLPLSAILMAGGKGERLRPATLTTPKPLLKIEGKAIIDYNIEALAAVGISDITVTTCYLADQIHRHFSEPVAGVRVRCFEEKMPLGTIGPAANIPLPEGRSTIVMNSDLLTSISFEEMFLHHTQHNADITIAAIPYVVSVPYAIIASESDSHAVTAIEEKPTYSYYANAGIYMIRNELLTSLPTGTRIDAPELISKAIAEGRKVVYYPLNGTWIDVGSPTDFRQAAELMRHHRNLNNG